MSKLWSRRIRPWKVRTFCHTPRRRGTLKPLGEARCAGTKGQRLQDLAGLRGPRAGQRTEAGMARDPRGLAVAGRSDAASPGAGVPAWGRKEVQEMDGGNVCPTVHTRLMPLTVHPNQPPVLHCVLVFSHKKKTMTGTSCPMQGQLKREASQISGSLWLCFRDGHGADSGGLGAFAPSPPPRCRSHRPVSSRPDPQVFPSAQGRVVLSQA